MATTTATITLSSTDLLSDELALSTTATLTTAGSSTGVTQCSGLSRKTVANNPIQSTILYRATDYTADKSNKVYIKNTSDTATEYFTVYIDQEQMGRLYAGDWCFFPWSATAGTRESFVVTIADTWAAGDTWEFDGITTTAANSTVGDIAAQIDAQIYPNWNTSVTSAAVTFTAKYAMADGVVTGTTAVTGDVVTTAGDGTAAITSGTTGTKPDADIAIVPSVATSMTYECMLIHE